MDIHAVTVKKYVSLAMEFQKHLFRESLKNGKIDHGENKKRTSKQKWNNRDYHVQNKDDVEHQHVKIFCGMAQFP